MITIDESKLAQLPTTNQLLDEKYGTEGTMQRIEFDAKAIAWYYGSLLRDRRRELKLTQREVAERIGREQTYIARIERGKVDIQLSSFIRIATVLGIQLIPSFISVMK
ncbi:MAG: helix-turn-helix transcriptional regulator [Paramuribaculum sp.]|nr:helix-turn-helix transcriptional regulator [Paramuribaculum sp.]MDE6782196.1 helix-turn-helix transcriptional regulator [Paramuribaculum sp.]